MNEYRDSHEREPGRLSATSSMLIEGQIRQPCHTCPTYTWEREQETMRLTGLYQAEPGLPADLAVFHLEGRLELPMLLLSTYSSPPGTLVQARLIGALGYSSSGGIQDRSLPSEKWVFVAVPEIDPSFSVCQSIEMLPPVRLNEMKAYVQATIREEQDDVPADIECCNAEIAARLLRETRLLLKQEQRMQSKGKRWLRREEKEEKPVAWRAIEGLSEVLRAQMLRNTSLQTDASAPHAQAEHLIQFVPQRFQNALADLLLDDERLLAFVERPLLRHGTGWLGMQTWRSNEGLFLVTDRQILWLRDFFAPGTSFLSGGYIAHSAPLERLQSMRLLPPGSTPEEFLGLIEAKTSPYLRLVLEGTSCTGSEFFVVEFPKEAEIEKALAQVIPILSRFLPSERGTEDRRLRRLPQVEAWMPRGAEAEQLAGLGGIVPTNIAQRLEARLAEAVGAPGEELLVSVLVPALEDFRSPARLIALTRRALLVLEDAGGKPRRFMAGQAVQAEQVLRFELANISSAILRYSLVGSSLSIVVPQSDGRSRQSIFPFHSPAIAWFLPLFTRLRLLLTGPYPNSFME